MKNLVIAFFTMCSMVIFAQENTSGQTNNWTSGRPDGHAPIGVMADHYHHKGEIMFSYRFMTMQMKELRYESDDVTNSDVFNNYMVAPQKMTMNMHMLGAMYAPSDRLTFMAMANYISNDMNLKMQMTNAMGMKMESDFSTVSSGFADISISALYGIFNTNRQSLHAQVGIVIPTGSIKEKDKTPMAGGKEILLPYPMQPGSGSFSGILGLTYLWQNEMFSGGVQGKSTLRINDNDEDYRLGNQYDFTSWLALKTNDYLSFSVRGELAYTDKITGKNDALMPMMVTTANTENSGGMAINYGIGANFLFPKGTLKDLRFATEVVMPAYQEPNGVQLKQQYTLMFGTQYAF